MKPMNASRAKRVVASIAGAVLVTLSVFAGTAAAQAAPSAIDPDAVTELVITKFEQPTAYGERPNGAPLGDDVIAELTAIPGVGFGARQVPGIDISTNAGQQQAAALTVAEATALVADQPVADSGVTDADGVLRLGGANGKLGVGLYYVEETDAPAGVVPSAPFLVALPLTNPAGAGWMYTVYVYPKNDKVEVAINVIDEDAVVCTDIVTWVTQNVIPHQATISKYISRNLVSPGLQMQSLDTTQVSISGAGAAELIAGVDYVLTAITEGDREGFEVEFTASGRAKLVEARNSDPTAKVIVSYPTRVAGPGEHVNEVQLTVDDSKPVTDTTVTKWGPLKIYVHERGNTNNAIPGAKFKLYLSAEDAAADRNPIEINGQTEFTTDEHGYITFSCLRFSDFVNGLDREPGDPLYRPYYGKPVSYPDGWTGEWDILAGVVNVTEEADAEVLIWQVWKGATPPELPVTGGQIIGAAMLAAVLLGGGALILLRRKKRDSDDHEELAEQ